MEFTRKVTVQVNDQFSSPYDFQSIVDEIKSQRVPGELLISFPGNGGVSGVVFRGKPVSHDAEI